MTEILNDSTGEIYLKNHFISEAECVFFYEHLMTSLAFEQQDIVMFGKKIAIPRLESFHSEDGKSYGYSGKRLLTKPFHPLLSSLKNKLENELSLRFNSVLINLYRNENDSNGWHSDDEKELGKNPSIASLSIGATRRFQIKSKNTSEKKSIMLQNGDLMLMSGAFQSNWKHQVPKEKFTCGPRINLTFRYIY